MCLSVIFSVSFYFILCRVLLPVVVAAAVVVIIAVVVVLLWFGLIWFV